LLKSASVEEAQGVARALKSLISLNPVAIGRDAKRGQTKTSSRDARYVAMAVGQRCAVRARTIRYESGFWIGLFPEIAEGALLEVVDEGLLRARWNAPQEQYNENRKAQPSDIFLPLDYFELRFNHVL
jgi:hypothetical protein